MKTNNKINKYNHHAWVVLSSYLLIMLFNNTLLAQTTTYSGSLQDERKLPLCTPGITPASTTLCSSGSTSTLTAPSNAPYLWSNGSTTQSNTVSPSSTTTYTVVCGNGCNRCISTVTVGVGTPTSATTSASASGLYTWAVNGLTYTLSGTYTYTSLNPSGCTHTQILNLTIVPVLSITTFLDQPIHCHGFADAGVQVQGIGTGSLTYNHNGGAFTNTTGYFQNLGPGSHSFCVKDANGNIACAPPLIITDPPPLALTFNTDNLVSCLGNDGTLSVNITGGTSVLQPYLTVWTNTANPTVILNNQLTNNFALSLSNLSVGNYNVAIEDDNGCFLNQTGSLLAAPPIVVSASWTPIPCNGGTTTIIPSATGGMPSAPLTYTINGIPLAASYVAGTYTVMATDAKGCTGTTVITVTQPPIDAGSINITSCNTYTWSANSATYTSSGVYVSTSLNASGCVHTSILNLTINQSTTSSSSATACDSYIWPTSGLTYTTSGIYTKTILNTTGCVNTSTLNLTINQSTTSSSSATACDSYTWPTSGLTYTTSGIYIKTILNASGCVNTSTLNLTINHSTSTNTSATACDSYTWSESGLTYTASGIYTKTILNATGCVNTSTLNLTINQSTTSITTITASSAYTWAVNGVTYTTSGTYTQYSLNSSGCTQTSVLILTITSANTTLNLDLFLQGYYIGGGMMTPTLMNEGVGNDPTVTDSITVQLYHPTSLNLVASTKTLLHTNGNAIAVFPAMSGSYYIAVKHRNSITTWSSLPVNMTTGWVPWEWKTIASKAYGSNQVQVSPGIWAFYSGDINQDENIDLNDLSLLENEINNFSSGYMNTDINGDGNVDILDLPATENNVNNFIFSAHP